MSSRNNADLVTQYFAAIDAREFDKLQDMFAPEYALHFDGIPAMNAQSAASFFEAFIAAFPDLQHPIQDMLVDGDRAAARILVQGTHQGEFMGRPATGNAILIGAINIFHFANGRIVESWINSDSLGLLQQIGAFPMPGQGGF